MGQPKQLLPVRGQTLLDHTITHALAAPVWPVIVVLGAHADTIRPTLARHPVLVAENPAWAEGMASSLRAGLAVLNAFSLRVDAAIVALCDQPAFSTVIIQRLLDTQQRAGTSLVAARYNDHLGAPALFTRAHFAALNALTGDEGARKLIARIPPADVTAVDLPELSLDLDTPGDVAAFSSKP